MYFIKITSLVFLLTTFFTTLLFLTGCENNDDPELTVIYNADCRGRPNINLSVDGKFWGTLAPGQDVSRKVKEGTHILTTDKGFGTFTVYVPPGGLVYDLYCR